MPISSGASEICTSANHRELTNEAQGWAELGFEVTEGIPHKRETSDGIRGRRSFSEFSGKLGILRRRSSEFPRNM